MEMRKKISLVTTGFGIMVALLGVGTAIGSMSLMFVALAFGVVAMMAVFLVSVITHDRDHTSPTSGTPNASDPSHCSRAA